MYISHQGLTAIHQERVEASLARSERQRMLKAAKHQRHEETAMELPRQSGAFRSLVTTLSGLLSRPSES